MATFIRTYMTCYRDVSPRFLRSARPSRMRKKAPGARVARAFALNRATPALTNARKAVFTALQVGSLYWLLLICLVLAGGFLGDGQDGA